MQNDNVMKTYNPRDECPKCGMDPDRVVVGWSTEYVGGFRGLVEGRELYGPEELQCICGKCGFKQRRKTLDAEV